MTEKRKKIILFSIIRLIILIALIKNTFSKQELYNNFALTKGTITAYHFNNNNYILKYKYVVNGITYESTETTDYFKCDDRTPGCKGKEFTVKYSSKDPSNSIMELGKYDNKRNKAIGF